MRHKSAAAGHVFTVSWHAGRGRQTRQFASLKQAQDEASMKVEQLAAGKISAAQSTTVEDASLLAELRKLAGATPPVAALTEWREAKNLCGGQLIPAARAWHEANAGGMKAVTVDFAATEFLRAKKRAGIDTSASYEFALHRIRDGLKGRPIASLSAKALEAWMHETFRTGGAQNAHPGTFNTVRKRVVALWRWSRTQGYLPRNVQTEAELLPTSVEDEMSIGILSLAEVADVLQHIRTKHPEHLGVTLLACFCGLRRSELHTQKWCDVVLQRRFVRVTRAKRNTPSKRLVPLSDAAVEWLMLCDRSTDLVSPPWGVDRIRAFVREAGIACPENAFRHSFISYRVAQTGNVAETSLEAGNSPAIVHKHYRQLVPKEDGEAWAALTPAAAETMGSTARRKVVGIVEETSAVR